jgi:hypothetical protein
VYSHGLREATKNRASDPQLADYFLVRRRIIRVDGAGQDAVQTPPAWMPGCNVVPSFDRHMTDAMISPASHSEVHPIEPQALLSMVLA